MNRLLAALLFAGTSTLGSPLPEAEFTAVADATIRDGVYAATNYGLEPTLEVKNSGSLNNSFNRWIYLKFDLSSIRGSVTSAALRLFGRVESNADVRLALAIYPVTNTSWDERTLTWKSQPYRGTTALHQVTVTSGPALWNEWDVGSYVTSEVAAGRRIVSVVVQCSTVSGALARFSSSEAASNRPHLLVETSDYSGRPRLYYTSAELPALRALRTASTHQAIWNKIKTWADENKGKTPPGENTSYSVMIPIRDYVETMTFAYSMTGDASYAAAAKRWMLSISSWSTWGNRHAAAYLIRAFAFGYDALHDALSDSERTAIRNAVAKATTSIYNTYSPDPQFAANYLNSLFNISCTIGLAGIALRGDHADADKWIEFGITHTQRGLAKCGADGGQYEGFYYSSIGMRDLLKFLDAAKRAQGVNLFGHPYLQNHAKFMIYGTYNGKPLQLEDSLWHMGYPAGDGANYLAFIYRLAREYQDGHAQHFAESCADPAGAFSFLWKDPKLAPKPPSDLPRVKSFPDEGYVFFRSGWGPQDLLLNFKSSTSQGHAHNAQNEFGIYGWGRPITCGPGYVVQTPLDDTWSHNAMLVDGAGQGQEPGDYQSIPLGTRGKIVAVEDRSPHYAYALGDATPPYAGKLSKWLRHVVFIQPNYFVVFDRVEASAAKQFDWLLHAARIGPNNATLTVNGDTATVKRDDGVRLEARILEPAGFKHALVDYNNPVSSTRKATYVKVRPPSNASSAQFLTVLFPLSASGSSFPVQRIASGNLIGARVTNGTRVDLILFSRNGEAVDQWIDLGAAYKAADGRTYSFSGNRVRAQFSAYQVMRLSR